MYLEGAQTSVLSMSTFTIESGFDQLSQAVTSSFNWCLYGLLEMLTEQCMTLNEAEMPRLGAGEPWYNKQEDIQKAHEI